MDQISTILTAIGLPPTALVTVLVLALVLRFARGMIQKFGGGLTLVTAGALGAAGGWFEAPVGAPIKDTVHIACAIMVAVLLAQKALQGLASKVSWLPEDNEWVKPPAPPSPPSPTQ